MTGARRLGVAHILIAGCLLLSNFPRFDRNPNTGEQPGLATETRPAAQTVYHDAERPSHIVLPVVPRSAHSE